MGVLRTSTGLSDRKHKVAWHSVKAGHWTMCLVSSSECEHEQMPRIPHCKGDLVICVCALMDLIYFKMMCGQSTR